MISQDDRLPVELLRDACIMKCGALCHLEAYYALLMLQMIARQHPICHLEVLNTVVAIRSWAPHLRGRIVRLYSDSTTSQLSSREGGENHSSSIVQGSCGSHALNIRYL